VKSPPVRKPTAARLVLLWGFAAALRLSDAATPAEGLMTSEDGDAVRVKSGYLDVRLSLSHPALLFLGVDSLGFGKVQNNVLAADSGSATRYWVEHSVTKSGASVRYSGSAAAGAASPGWTIEATGRGLRFASQWSAAGPPAPLTLSFDTRRCYSTLLGLFDARGDIPLPAVLHLPGFGTLRLTSGGAPAALGYASGPGWIRVTLPAASESRPDVAYRWDVTTLCPDQPGAPTDHRYDGFRRNWLNIFQLNPNRRMLSNNTNSDTCGFCYYQYADIARETPPLADNLYALDMVRQSLELVLAGARTYGMPGYGDFPEETSDTFPSLLIAALDYAEGRRDTAWLRRNYSGLRAWAERMLATDRDGRGLIQYAASGNAGSWPEGPPKVRPSNWWDTIGFGHEDAYANALAYRALRGMHQMAAELERTEDAVRYEAAARRLHDAYFSAFFDPSTGVLAGWRSADGQLHDYYFLYVNGIAILYGLVPPDRAAGIMDRLWDKMRQVGYSDFRLGLPGNLVPVARRDYAHKDPRYGGGAREDNADGFQVYENGGATACYAYFTIAALDRVGRHTRAERILFPILGAFDRREFEETGRNGRTNDWRKWDGTAEGYEGFLVDNYYTLLAVPRRSGPGASLRD
jgi:hypothetical protein